MRPVTCTKINEKWHIDYIEETKKGIMKPPDRPTFFDGIPFYLEGGFEDTLQVCEASSSLPSVLNFLSSFEWCPQLRATKAWASNDPDINIRYILDNEIVAWFILFLFTNIASQEYKGYATISMQRLCSETYDVAPQMLTIDQTTADESLLELVLSLTLDDKDNLEVVRQACSAVAFLCGFDILDLTFGAGVQNKLIELAKCKIPDLALPALRALRYIVLRNIDMDDDERMFQRILKEEHFLLDLLGKKHGDHNGVLKEACWTVDSFVRYKNELEDYIVTRFIPPIVKLSSCGDSNVERAAMKVILTAMETATITQIRELAEMDCLKALCTHLNSYPYDDDFLTRSLDGIKIILRAGDAAKGHRNRFAKKMDECHGWFALEEVTLSRAVAIARDIVVEYREEDEQDHPYPKRNRAESTAKWVNSMSLG